MRNQYHNRQRTMEGIDGGLHPAVDEQSPGETCVKKGDHTESDNKAASVRLLVTRRPH